MEGLQSRLFQVAGKMVAYKMVHMNIGIPFLSPCVYDYIVSESLDHALSYCSVEDLCEFELKELTENVLPNSRYSLYSFSCLHHIPLSGGQWP